MGREGADGVEQGASMAAREAEGDDEDEAMAGDENISVQRAEGGGGSTGGIKKRKPRRGKQKHSGARQALALAERRLAAVEASGSRAEWRERKGSDFCVGNDCGKGPLARVGHLGERDAALTGLEILGRGAYVPSFSPPIPPLYVRRSVDLEPISSSA